MLRSPGFELFDQGESLGAVLGGFGAHFLQPFFDHFVGPVASLVETFPQGMVGQAPLVGLLPLLAQLAQGFLHLAPAHDGHPFDLHPHFGRLGGRFLGGRRRSVLSDNGGRFFRDRRSGLRGDRRGWLSGHRLGFVRHGLEQSLGLGHQLSTELVCAPALPTFKFAGSGQHGLGMVF